ncbi:MAG: porin family protein [Proteobacteria bacterium]|nr:porin family protein [Pseudomonadota bacterium]
MVFPGFILTFKRAIISKMINRKFFEIIIAGILFLILSFNISSAETQIDDKGWFTGIFTGYASTKVETNNVFTQNNNTVIYGLYGGYNFTKWFGLEGKFMATDDVADNRTDLKHAKFSSIILTPKLTYRFNDRNSMFFKTGIAWLVYTEEYEGFWSTRRQLNKFGKYYWRGGVIPLSIGMQIDIVKGLKCRISYDRMAGQLNADSTFKGRLPNVNVELNQVLAGLHYQF